MSQSRSRKKSTSSSRNISTLPTIHEDGQPPIDLSEAQPEAQISTSGDPSELYSVPAQAGEDIETTDYITEMNKYHSFPSHVLVEMMTMLKTAAFQNTAKGKYYTKKLRLYLHGTTAVGAHVAPYRKHVIEIYLSLLGQRLDQIMQLTISDREARTIAKTFAALGLHSVSPQNCSTLQPILKATLGMNEQLAIMTAGSKLVFQVEKHLREGSSAQTQTYS